MADDIAITVENVSKDFILPHERTKSIKGAFTSMFKSKSRGKETQHALKDISFEVKKGEFLGIVGRNGSGKSTLLKIMAGIYTPTKGKVSTSGKLVPFIELGVGFNPELTGRENVYLNGALLGFSKEEIDEQYNDIVEFAELERFMDQKLKNYSSGMQVRLAFSVATRANADILILDEVLAVGDEAFQRKCFNYFATLKRDKKTVVFVTHNMDQVQQFCTKAILVDKEHKVEIGSPLDIAQIYQELNDSSDSTINTGGKLQDVSTNYIGAKVNFINHSDKLEFDVTIKPKQDLDDPIIALEIYRNTGEQLVRWVTDEKIGEPIELKSGRSYRLNIVFDNIFPVGLFSARLIVRRRDRAVDYGVFNNISKFTIKNETAHKFNNYWKPHDVFSLKTEDE